MSAEHIRVLARTNARMPPIIVHRSTMCVIDGVQRVRAAELSARDHVEAQFFDGDEDDAFVLAVEANTANGLPLSVADRKAAAARIIVTHPTRSDRWIALVSGLTASTVGEIRRCSTVEDARSNTRIGRDGRRRPLDSSEGRRLAGELMRADANRSLRDIARAAGIAPSTVLDVRNRISRGEDPVPARKEAAEPNRPAAGAGAPRRQTTARADVDPDPAAIMRTLCKDPSLRLTEAGRTLLRWLDAHTVTGQAAPPVADIPAHCAGAVAALARHNARSWAAFGDRISAQDEEGGQTEHAWSQPSDGTPAVK
ncbi:streptomycin biosynthesis protein [Umezawaea endophytica]|uniref:ParB/RepB/Spo0J family partition protein n=1 Tax=Umezawaea endophytica TaxID=1654476 RepID=A0A9X2VI00_9PSEU|nr:ParB/RepB/Spo0J family partition protein [Umezawaea endophytica]MCS7477010.1 ParB/RepB/Spo0J family partition protein [Umezawaea endophytica]